MKNLLLKLRKVIFKMNQEKRIEKLYPLAKTIDSLPLMSKGGTYKNGFPEGIVLHFTAGWQNQKGSDAISFANKNGHRYFFIDEKGEVFQQFCLSGYGPHAGESECPVTKRKTVSQYYVGIEVACGGKLNNGKTWYGKSVAPENQRIGTINNKWQKASGAYEAFTDEQELAVKKLCTWLCENGCNPDLIFSHEEVSPRRKDDVGLSLSLTMDEFRKTIKGSMI